MQPIGLILEGGGMRGIYTAGVLDYLMDEGIWLSDVYGVSAGACHGTSYISRQRGRAARTVLDYAGDKRYGSFSNLLHSGNFFGEKFVYEDIPKEHVPFDYDTYAKAERGMCSVVTDCRTGKPAYLLSKDLHADMPQILASSSLPLLSKMVVIDGVPYLDGGVADSIPIGKSIEDGHAKNLVILTQHRGYVKRENKMMPLIQARYRKYPGLVEALRVRHEMYNAQLAHVYREEAEGRAVVIQPGTPVDIRKFEKRRDVLQALYDQGYEEAAAQRDSIDALLA